MTSSARLWLGRGLFALLLGPAALPAQAGQPSVNPLPTVPAPQRFEWVLWCSDLAASAPAARQLGFTAVQVGRGIDPSPATTAGLGYYLDQPIGKGLLELRDEAWRPVASAYERSRDPTTLVRPACFAVPGAVTAAAAAAATEVARVAGAGLRFVALADEPSATRHDAPLDTCRCEHCLAAFRRFAEARFGDLATCNRTLGTEFPDFAALQPPTTDQVRRRELGDVALPLDLRAFAVWLDFVDAQYADAVNNIARRAQAAAPTVPVGLTGLSAPAAFGGGDPSRIWPQLTLVEPYTIGGAPELARCLAPAAAHRYATLSPPAAGAPVAAMVRAQLAAIAAQGLAGVVVWNDAAVLDASGQATPYGAAVVAAMDAYRSRFDALAGAAVVPASVWVVESQASVRAWWMLDSAGDGMTWVRRLASYEATHSTSQAARLGWIRLLQDLGLQPRFVAEAALPERLLRERPRCLVLPASVSLADRTLQAIQAYAQGGGTVLADHSTAIYDGELRRRDRGGLDALFGIEQRSLAWSDLLVREGRSTSRRRGLPLAEHGLRGVLGEATGDGDAFLEREHGRGRAVYLNAPVAGYAAWRLLVEQVEPARELRRRVRSVLERAGLRPPCVVRGAGLPTCLELVPLRLRSGRQALVVRINALEAPALLQQLAADGPRAVGLEWPDEITLRELGGDEIGRGQRFELRLDVFGALFLEVAR